MILGGRDKIVHAIDTATGKAAWTFATRARVDSSPGRRGRPRLHRLGRRPAVRARRRVRDKALGVRHRRRHHRVARRRRRVGSSSVRRTAASTRSDRVGRRIWIPFSLPVAPVTSVGRSSKRCSQRNTTCTRCTPGSENKLPSGALPVLGNALDGASFAGAIPPGATVVHLVGTPHPNPAKATGIPTRRSRIDQGHLAAAQRSAVRHLVYVSVAHPAPVMQAYIAARQEGELLVRTSGIRATIVSHGTSWGRVIAGLICWCRVYAILRWFPTARDGAERLGLVTRRAMIATLVRDRQASPGFEAACSRRWPTSRDADDGASSARHADLGQRDETSDPSIHREMKGLAIPRVPRPSAASSRPRRANTALATAFSASACRWFESSSANYQGLSLRDLAALLKSPWHEERLLALLILVRQYSRAEPARREAIYRLYMSRTAQINNWDLVDCSAEHIVGAHLRNGAPHAATPARQVQGAVGAAYCDHRHFSLHQAR